VPNGRRVLIVLLLTLVVVAAGCGGDGNGDGGSPSTAEWADQLCTAVNDWTGSLSAATDSLQGNPSVDGLKEAANDLKSSTETFVDDVKGLGAPDTEAGEEAKDSVDQLADQVEGEVDEMKSAADDVSGPSDLLGAVSTISGSLAAIGGQVSSTLSELGQLGAGGELEDAFNESDACQDLRNN